jgi:hypothetical protein
MSGELRIPIRLAEQTLAEKKIRLLWFLACAKLHGHRIDKAWLFSFLKLHQKTGERYVKELVRRGWAGTDGIFIYPRAWQKIKHSKRGGIYIQRVERKLKRFEAFCFAFVLKRLVARKGSPRSNYGRALQSDYPTGYLCRSLGLKERKFKTLKAEAQRYRYISVHPRYRVIGNDSDFEAMKKNLHGLPIFKRGKFTVTPDISEIRFLI